MLSLIRFELWSLSQLYKFARMSGFGRIQSASIALTLVITIR
jgi:hypothetical protein